MKKLLKWGVPAVVLLVIVVLVVGYLQLNGIVRDRVEVGAQQSLNLPTELDSARVSLFSSDASLGGLAVGNPGGFSQDAMLSVGQIDVDASYSDLLADPMRVADLRISGPRLLLEQDGGRFNFKAASDGLPPSEGETLKVIVDKLVVTDTTVEIRPNLPGVEPLTSWKVGLIGDPLYRPFAAAPLLPTEALPEALRDVEAPRSGP